MDKQRDTIRKLLYLEKTISDRINAVIEEELLRDRCTQESILRLKESLECVIDEQIAYIKLPTKTTE